MALALFSQRGLITCIGDQHHRRAPPGKAIFNQARRVGGDVSTILYSISTQAEAVRNAHRTSQAKKANPGEKRLWRKVTLQTRGKSFVI
jgi:hypothetical protein